MNEELTAMERYRRQLCSYRHLYIPLFSTLSYEELERRQEQRRIEAMDPMDYQLELDCAALCELDSLLPKEVSNER